MYNYNSQTELFNACLPAIKAKIRLLKNDGINYVKETDIWNCIRDFKWKFANGLSISEVVNDIIHTDSRVIDAYSKRNNC